MHFKNTIVVFTTLLIMTGVGSAATITISDLLDGNPIVTLSSDLTSPETSLSSERAVITGLLPASVQIAPGTRSVILTEPTTDPFGSRTSDFITLVVGAAAPTYSILFESDGAATFDRDVAALPTDTPKLLEDGTFQDVSALLHSGNLSIAVQSDLSSPEPEPSTWVLLFSGLLAVALGYFRRKRA